MPFLHSLPLNCLQNYAQKQLVILGIFVKKAFQLVFQISCFSMQVLERRFLSLSSRLHDYYPYLPIFLKATVHLNVDKITVKMFEEKVSISLTYFHLVKFL